MPRAGGKGRKGDYYEYHPVDAEILRRLPPEGASVGWHIIAATVNKIADAMNKDVPVEGRVTPSQISGRLVSMKIAGLVVRTKVLGDESDKHGWQRTRKGTLFREEKTGERLADETFSTSPKLEVVKGGD